MEQTAITATPHCFICNYSYPPSNWIIFFTNTSDTENFWILFEFVLKQVACASSALLPHSLCPSAAAHRVHCHGQMETGPGREHSAGIEVSERRPSQEMPSFQWTTQCPGRYTFSFANYPEVILTIVVNLLSPNEIYQQINPLISFYIYCAIGINPARSVLIYDTESRRIIKSINPLCQK